MRHSLVVEALRSYSRRPHVVQGYEVLRLVWTLSDIDPRVLTQAIDAPSADVRAAALTLSITDGHAPEASQVARALRDVARTNGRPVNVFGFPWGSLVSLDVAEALHAVRTRPEIARLLADPAVADALEDMASGLPVAADDLVSKGREAAASLRGPAIKNSLLGDRHP